MVTLPRYNAFDRRLNGIINRQHTCISVFQVPSAFRLLDDIMDYCPASIEMLPDSVMGNVLLETMNGHADRYNIELCMIGGEHHDRSNFLDFIEDARHGLCAALQYDMLAVDPTIFQHCLLMTDYTLMPQSSSICLRYLSR